MNKKTSPFSPVEDGRLLCSSDLVQSSVKERCRQLQSPGVPYYHEVEGGFCRGTKPFDIRGKIEPKIQLCRIFGIFRHIRYFGSSGLRLLTLPKCRVRGLFLLDLFTLSLHLLQK
jgi:hypothetical protein